MSKSTLDDCFTLTQTGFAVPKSQFMSETGANIAGVAAQFRDAINNLNNTITIPTWHKDIPGALLTHESIVAMAKPTPASFQLYKFGFGGEIIIPFSIEGQKPISSMRVQTDKDLAEIPNKDAATSSAGLLAVGKAQHTFLAKYVTCKDVITPVITDNDYGHTHSFKVGDLVMRYHKQNSNEFSSHTEREFVDVQGNTHTITYLAHLKLPTEKPGLIGGYDLDCIRFRYAFQAKGKDEPIRFGVSRDISVECIDDSCTFAIDGIELAFGNTGELQYVEGKLTPAQMSNALALPKIDYAKVLKRLNELTPKEQGMASIFPAKG